MLAAAAKRLGESFSSPSTGDRKETRSKHRPTANDDDDGSGGGDKTSSKKNRRRRHRTEAPTKIEVRAPLEREPTEHSLSLAKDVNEHFATPAHVESHVEYVSAKTLRLKLKKGDNDDARRTDIDTAWLEPTRNTLCYEAVLYSTLAAKSEPPSSRRRIESLVRSAFGIERDTHSQTRERIASAIESTTTITDQLPQLAIGSGVSRLDRYSVLLHNLYRYETIQQYSSSLEKAGGDKAAAPRFKLLSLGRDAEWIRVEFLRRYELPDAMVMLCRLRVIRCYAEHTIHFGEAALKYVDECVKNRRHVPSSDELAERSLLARLIEDNLACMWRVFHGNYHGALKHHLQLFEALSTSGDSSTTERLQQCIERQVQPVYDACVSRARAAVAAADTSRTNGDSTTNLDPAIEELMLLCDLLDECMNDLMLSYKREFDKYNVDVCRTYATGLCRALGGAVQRFTVANSQRSSAICGQTLPLAKKLFACVSALREHSPNENDWALDVLRHLDPFVGMWVASTLAKIDEWTRRAVANDPWNDTGTGLCNSLIDAFQACAQSITFVRERPYLRVSSDVAPGSKTNYVLFAQLAVDRCATTYARCALDAQLSDNAIDRRVFERFEKQLLCVASSSSFDVQKSRTLATARGAKAVHVSSGLRANSVEYTRTILVDIEEQMNKGQRIATEYLADVCRRHTNDSLRVTCALAYTVCCEIQPLLIRAMYSHVKSDMNALVEQVCQVITRWFESPACSALHRRPRTHLYLLVWRHVCTIVRETLLVEPTRLPENRVSLLGFTLSSSSSPLARLSLSTSTALDTVHVEWATMIVEAVQSLFVDSPDSIRQELLHNSERCPEYASLREIIELFDSETSTLLDLSIVADDDDRAAVETMATTTLYRVLAVRLGGRKEMKKAIEQRRRRQQQQQQQLEEQDE